MAFHKTMDLCLSFTNGSLSNGLLSRILIASITVLLGVGCMNMRVSKQHTASELECLQSRSRQWAGRREARASLAL